MTIRIASAPVSWGIFEFKGIEAQYTFGQVLDEIKAAGYTGTELGPWGFLPTDPARLRAELDSRGLTLLSAFVPVRFADPTQWDEGEAVALSTARLLAGLGCTIIVLADDNTSDPVRTARAGSISAADGLSADQWKSYCRGVDRIAQRVMNDYGLAVAFHHHCGGWVETPDEIARLLDGTHPDRVKLCLDAGHYRYGGGDPVQAAQTLGGRINHLHFKDCDVNVLQRVQRDGLNYMQAVAASIFPELGKGDVDFRALVANLEKHHYEGWGVVEQDLILGEGSSPLASATRNRAYLRSIGL